MQFWKQKNKQVSLVCDIGSASIAMAVVDFSFTKPQVIFSIRVPIAIQAEYTPKTLQKSLLSYIDTALAEITKVRKENTLFQLSNVLVQNAHLFFSSPWYASNVINSAEKMDKPILLDKKFYDELLDKAESKFENEILKSSQSGWFGDIHTIEREILLVKLNGYVTGRPLMKKASEFFVSTLVSVVSHELLLKIVEKISNSFHTEKVYSHTFPYITWRALADVSRHETEYVALDIAGETTDVMVIRDSNIQMIRSVDIGRNSLIRSLAMKMDCSFEIVLSTIALYSAGKLDEVAKKRIDDALSAFMAIWRFKIEEVGKGEVFNLSSYKKFFVTIEDDVAGPFVTALKNSIGDERAVFQITNSLLDEFLVYNKHVGHDPFIAIESIFLKKLYTEHLH